MFNKNWILFIAPGAYPCKVGGLEIFNHYLMNELCNYYPLHVITYCDEVEYTKIETHKLKKMKFQKVSSPLSLLGFIFKNRKSIKLLHVSFAKAYWTHWVIYVILKKLFGIKYIITIHGGGIAQWKPKLPYKLFFKNAESITGVSDRIITEYSKRSGRKIIYTPPLIPFNIIDEKDKYRDKWGIALGEKILLYVGALKPLKSVDTLIEALGHISIRKLQEYNLKVLIAGDGISRKKLENNVNRLNLQNNVIFLGNIERDSINQLYNLANFYTICSEFEGLPISLLEAFANKLPCITSDAPGLIDVSLNNRNTLLFKTKDSYDYANKLEKLIKDNRLQKKLSNNANTYFEKNYSFKKLVRDFKEIINKVD